MTQPKMSPTPENENVQNVSFQDHFKSKDPNSLRQPDPSPSVKTDCSTTRQSSQRHSNPLAHTPASPKTRKVFDAHLLTEILDLTGDIKSKSCWISVINQVPEERIRYALSCLRMTMNDGTVLDRPGAYLPTIVMANNPDLTLKGAKCRSSSTHRSQIIHHNLNRPIRMFLSSPPQPEARRFHDPEPDPVEEIDTETLIKGWKIFYNPNRIQSVLFNVSQCLPDWNVSGAWRASNRIDQDSRSWKCWTNSLSWRLSRSSFNLRRKGMPRHDQSNNSQTTVTAH